MDKHSVRIPMRNSSSTYGFVEIYEFLNGTRTECLSMFWRQISCCYLRYNIALRQVVDEHPCRITNLFQHYRPVFCTIFILNVRGSFVSHPCLCFISHATVTRLILYFPSGMTKTNFFTASNTSIFIQNLKTQYNNKENIIKKDTNKIT